MKKQAILVVSFGTSHPDTQVKNIGAIEDAIRDAYPDYRIYSAWTSGMILSLLRTRDKIQINNVNEAMQEMITDGITDLIVQPTHVINGIEHEQMKESVSLFQSHFHSICFGNPLLTDTDDYIAVSKEIMKNFPSIATGKQISSDSALVLMGHGTSHYANATYAALDYTFKNLGYPNVFVGTVESYPSVDSLLKNLENFHIKHIYLTPLMVVAGDHAVNDMASDTPTSWKVRFENAGYSVHCLMKGLGEYEGIRSIYIQHIKNGKGSRSHGHNT